MAGRVRESEFLMGPAVFAAVVASSMMFLRMLFEVAVINPSLLGFIAPPMIVMGGLGFLLGFLFTRTPSDMESDIKIENPFSIKPALIFGALFMGILFISKAASIYLGRSGLLMAAMVSGVADVDAITVSLSVLAGAGSISSDTAAAAITIAGISNTLVKTGIAFLLGTKKFGKRVGMVFLAVIAAGVLTVFLTVL